jgi:hypothetical protein
MTIAGVACICGITLIAWGTASAQVAPPGIPESLKVPDTEVILPKAVGKGKQVYVCSAKPGDESQFAWVLDRPRADLLDDQGQVIGKHYKGPVWEAADGSTVAGVVQQHANAPDAKAVPWLLLKVTYIQRVDTEGGLAPADGCDKAHAGAEASADYQATYYFYGPRP